MTEQMTDDTIRINDVEYIRKDRQLQSEKDVSFIDPANVMMMGKVKNVDQSDKPLHLLFDYPHRTGIIGKSDLLDGETFEVFKDKEYWGKYSLCYFEQVKRVTAAWNGQTLRLVVQKEKHQPLLVYAGELGFIIAPRIETEDE